MIIPADYRSLLRSPSAAFPSSPLHGSAVKVCAPISRTLQGLRRPRILSMQYEESNVGDLLLFLSPRSWISSSNWPLMSAFPLPSSGAPLSSSSVYQFCVSAPLPPFSSVKLWDYNDTRRFGRLALLSARLIGSCVFAGRETARGSFIYFTIKVNLRERQQNPTWIAFVFPLVGANSNLQQIQFHPNTKPQTHKHARVLHLGKMC